MTQQPTVYIVCSDRGRNGKTLLARVLVDHLLLEERDPFCFDLSYPEGALRAYFPGRTALIDISAEDSRRKLFDIVLGRIGRDYVIDVPGAHLARFCEVAGETDFAGAARNKGFRVCMLYVVDREATSLKTAIAVEDMLQPDLLVPVVNRFVGSCLPEGVPGPVVILEKIEGELQAIVANRRFSLRAFLLGDDSAVPARLRAHLKNFLHSAQAGLRNLEPALSLQTLHGAEI